MSEKTDRGNCKREVENIVNELLSRKHQMNKKMDEVNEYFGVDYMYDVLELLVEKEADIKTRKQLIWKIIEDDLKRIDLLEQIIEIDVDGVMEASKNISIRRHDKGTQWVLEWLDRNNPQKRDALISEIIPASVQDYTSVRSSPRPSLINKICKFDLSEIYHLYDFGIFNPAHCWVIGVNEENSLNRETLRESLEMLLSAGADLEEGTTFIQDNKTQIPVSGTLELACLLYDPIINVDYITDLHGPDQIIEALIETGANWQRFDLSKYPYCRKVIENTTTYIAYTRREALRERYLRDGEQSPNSKPRI